MPKTKTPAPSPNVKVDIPHMPPLYTSQHKKKFLPWTHAEQRLINSRSYWICTARPDGRPHSIPVWGMWVDDALYFGTARDARKAKNIANNPAVSVHLESGDDVVILEGKAIAADVSEKKLRAKLDRECQRKYNMPLLVMPESICYRVRPRIVLAWLEKEFPFNSTRWEFKVES